MSRFLRTTASLCVLSFLLLAIFFGAAGLFAEEGKETSNKKKEPNKSSPDERRRSTGGSYVVLGYNNLGMHCMNQDFSQLCILPPFNSLYAQVIQVGAPWVSEPSCGSCHKQRRPEFEFEEPGKLFKDSRGHHGVHCAACHGSPHAIGPAVTAVDNLQAIEHQGFAGTIRKCTVCHATTPNERFEHKLD